MFKYDHGKSPLENGMQFFKEMKLLGCDGCEYVGYLTIGKTQRQKDNHRYVWIKNKILGTYETIMDVYPQRYMLLSDVTEWEFVDESLNRERLSHDNNMKTKLLKLKEIFKKQRFNAFGIDSIDALTQMNYDECKVHDVSKMISSVEEMTHELSSIFNEKEKANEDLSNDGWKKYNTELSPSGNGMELYREYDVCFENMARYATYKLCLGSPNNLYPDVKMFLWRKLNSEYPSLSINDGFSNPDEWTSSFRRINKFRIIE